MSRHGGGSHGGGGKRVSVFDRLGPGNDEEITSPVRRKSHFYIKFINFVSTRAVVRDTVGITRAQRNTRGLPLI